MGAGIMDGRKTAESIRTELKERVERLKTLGVTPGLGVVLVGDNPASHTYVNAKKKACADTGIYSSDVHLPADSVKADLFAVIDGMNRNPAIHGILVQLPLPAHFDESEVFVAIDPEKDVDGFHPVNVGRIVTGGRAFMPCTPHGVVQLLVRHNVKISGANVVILGRSNIVGKPLANMLAGKSAHGNATVTICHTATVDTAAHTRMADIVVAATGCPGTLTADMIKEGAVVVDVGINRVKDDTCKSGFRIVGDVDFDSVKEKASLITPVPGGVGPMTIAMLLSNTVESAEKVIVPEAG